MFKLKLLEAVNFCRRYKNCRTSVEKWRANDEKNILLIRTGHSDHYGFTVWIFFVIRNEIVGLPIHFFLTGCIWIQLKIDQLRNLRAALHNNLFCRSNRHNFFPFSQTLLSSESPSWPPFRPPSPPPSFPVRFLKSPFWLLRLLLLLLLPLSLLLLQNPMVGRFFCLGLVAVPPLTPPSNSDMSTALPLDTTLPFDSSDRFSWKQRQTSSFIPLHFALNNKLEIIAILKRKPRSAKMHKKLLDRNGRRDEGSGG